MDSEASITYYMLEDHKELDKALGRLTDGFGLGRAEIKDYFYKFKDKLENHLRVEEQAIFSFANLGSSDTAQIVRDLLVEHGVIRNLMEDLTLEAIKGGRLSQLSELAGLLDRHQIVENQTLYPKLDKELDFGEKKFILQKINSLR